MMKFDCISNPRCAKIPGLLVASPMVFKVVNESVLKDH